MRKMRGLWVTVVVIVWLLTACGKKEEYVAAPESKVSVEMAPVQVTTAPETEHETEEETEETVEEPEERIAVDGKIKSYLTGEMVDVAKADRRPVAVMMSNDKAALPQYGINRAGVVYEAPVEGSMNRYMAILEDYDDLDRIGSVRSCRTYYTYFAREFDAIYAHFGQSTFALPYLDNVDNINGIKEGSQAFYRSSDKKTPHNAYTSAQKLQKTIEQLGYSQTYDPSYHGHFHFTKNGQQIHLDNSLEAEKIVPGYALNNSYLQYD